MSPSPTIGHKSEQGPRPSMQDEVIIRPNQFINSSLLQNPISFFSVLDGHGGQTAAKFTRDRLFDILVEKLKVANSVEEALMDAYKTTDEQFAQQNSGSQFTKPDYSGTCAVSCLISQTQLWCANAGDSRAILVKNSGIAIGLTRDHKASAPSEKKRIEEAGGHVVRNRVEAVLAIGRSIGDNEFQVNGNKLVIPDPDIQNVSLDDCEYLVLACDGVFDVMTNEEVAKFVYQNRELDAQEISRKLVAHVLNDLKTQDNVTAIIVNLKDLRANKGHSNS